MVEVDAPVALPIPAPQVGVVGAGEIFEGVVVTVDELRAAEAHARLPIQSRG